jgi:hypothetical protein
MQKELYRNSFKPKLLSGKWEVESRVKALWAKSKQSVTFIKEETETTKSLNSTSMETLKLSTITKKESYPVHRCN